MHKPPIIRAKGNAVMFFWIAAGYVLTAAAFYSYIAATAQEDPYQEALTLSETPEWMGEQSVRKAA